MVNKAGLKILAQIKAGAKEERVEKIGEGNYKVWVKAPPLEGKANQAVIKTLSKYFKVPKSSVAIVFGFKSKKKIIRIIK